MGVSKLGVRIKDYQQQVAKYDQPIPKGVVALPMVSAVYMTCVAAVFLVTFTVRVQPRPPQVATCDSFAGGVSCNSASRASGPLGGMLTLAPQNNTPCCTLNSSLR